MAKKSMSGQIKSTTLKTSTLEENPHLKTLSTHKHIYDLYTKCGEIVCFHHHIQAEVLEAYRSYDPHYRYNSSCPVCVAEFLNTAYKWYESEINKLNN